MPDHNVRFSKDSVRGFLHRCPRDGHRWSFAPNLPQVALGKVVAQALHYVSAISNWTYADLQRQVSMATGRKGNIPYESIRQLGGSVISEKGFIDAVSRSLREGRFLVLIAGDGIREGVQSLAELVSRNATKAFSFGLIEVAIYEFSNGRLMIQPRILAETEVIERQFISVSMKDGAETIVEEDENTSEVDGPIRGGSRIHLKAWWQPILDMKFDDPEQEPPYWVVTNNVVLNTPYPGVVIKAWSSRSNSGSGVFLSQTRAGSIDAIGKFIKRDNIALEAELPEGTQVLDGTAAILLRNDDLSGDDEKHAWLQKNLNAFVNILRPRLKAWHQESIA